MGYAGIIEPPVSYDEFCRRCRTPAIPWTADSSHPWDGVHVRSDDVAVFPGPVIEAMTTRPFLYGTAFLLLLWAGMEFGWPWVSSVLLLCSVPWGMGAAQRPWREWRRKRVDTVWLRGGVKDSAEFRRECREAAKCDRVSVLEEPLLVPTWPTGRRMYVRSSVWWRYYRRYGKAP